MNLDQVHRAYFLGIGGIGMSALARWFKSRGVAVSGYDRTPTSLTDKLIDEGISIHFEDDPEMIDEEVLKDQDKSLIIFTPAIPADHKELNELKSRGFTLFKRSEVLGMITADHFTVAVAGTHGKTSTSSIIAHIIHTSGKNCTAFIGGIMVNYQSNLILPRSNEDVIVVVEADEFDRSFLRLNPNLAVVTAADADHLDIYGDADNLRQSFRDFIDKISAQGELFIKEKVAEELQLGTLPGVRQNFYDLTKAAIHAENIRVEEGTFIFDYVSPEKRIDHIEFGFPGRHNIENCLAAISVALHLNIPAESIRRALLSYEGVKRRFEFVFKSSTVTYVDDYAHHPEEIRSFLSALRELYPGKKITAIFQPHLYTRTRDFAAGFAESLALADEVILIPIYPARELPIKGIDSGIILRKITLPKKSLIRKDEVLKTIASEEPEILATIGAGDIDQLVVPIKEFLKEKYDSV